MTRRGWSTGQIAFPSFHPSHLCRPSILSQIWPRTLMLPTSFLLQFSHSPEIGKNSRKCSNFPISQFPPDTRPHPSICSCWQFSSNVTDTFLCGWWKHCFWLPACKMSFFCCVTRWHSSLHGSVHPSVEILPPPQQIQTTVVQFWATPSFFKFQLFSGQFFHYFYFHLFVVVFFFCCCCLFVCFFVLFLFLFFWFVEFFFFNLFISEHLDVRVLRYFKHLNFRF